MMDTETAHMNPDPSLSLSVDVAKSPHTAFDIFTGALIQWWPPDYTWSQDKLEHLAIEPWVGGRCFELGPDDFRIDWGTVLKADAPHRLVFLWQISMGREPVPDPERASRVAIDFAGDGSGTSVRLIHSAFDKHGEGWKDYRGAMASDHGWPLILARFERYCRGEKPV
jgi:uncharacterized protein YndB with AHSA1/START domain